MQNKTYEVPEMEIVILENEDVIVTSGPGDELWETPIG